MLFRSKLNYNGDVVEAKGQPMEVEEHFDFKVDGSVQSGSNSRESGNQFAYAYFRDELKEVNQLQYFDNELFKLYTGIRDSNRDRTLTMRQISEGSDISTKTIFYSIKRSKNLIQEKLRQKYYDYLEINNGKIIDTCKLADPKREDYKDEMEGYE